MNQASLLVLADVCLVESSLFSWLGDILFQSKGMSIKKKAIFTTVIYQSMALHVLLICMTEFWQGSSALFKMDNITYKMDNITYFIQILNSCLQLAEQNCHHW